MDLLDRSVFSKFENHTAVKYYDSKSSLLVVSYGQLWNDIQKIANSLKEHRIEGQLVGVQLPHSAALIAVIGGIIISGNSFCCFDDDSGYYGYGPALESKQCCALFISDRGAYDGGCDQFQYPVGMHILSTHVTLVVTRSRQRKISEEIAFCVRTSGSTGSPKTVLVPKSCIMPNVAALGSMFELCERDTIFVCSPPTFDPFVVDILMGLRVGATLLLVAKEIKLVPKRLSALLFPGVTFMQMTPSLFTRWNSREMTEIILAPHSTLRVLVLGGEKFPTSISIPAGSRTDIYNIYGITELSCWSMIEKVTHEKLRDVPLGLPLDQSIILELRSVQNDQLMAEKNDKGSTVGHLFIGSKTRKCTVLESSDDEADSITISAKPLFRSTGDLVELTNENQYFYRGRCERIVKRFGCRVSLFELEEVLRAHEAIEHCAACVIGDDVRLVMFFTACGSEHVSLVTGAWQHLRTKLPPHKLPDEIYRIEHLPLSSHGKISTDGLLELYDQQRRHRTIGLNSRVEFLRAELVAMGMLHPSVRENNGQKRQKMHSFIDHGGTSICAMRLYATMEKSFGSALPELLTHLLDPTVSLEDVFKYLESQDAENSPGKANLPPPENLPVGIMGDENRMLSILCRYDMGKCIDTCPAVIFCKDLGYILSVGSHSGLLLTIRAATNDIVCRVSLPDRIECSTSFFTLDDATLQGVVGCYDGHLYCFNPLNGQIVWRYDAGGMIKCCPLVLPETDAIVVGSYGSTHNLHCVRGSDGGTLRWKLKIGSKPILAQPIALGGNCTGCVFVANLDGTIASVDVELGKIVWSSTLSGSVPVFSTPAYFTDYGKVIVCRVDGTMSVHDITTGEETSCIRLPGNVFSSFEIVQQSATTFRLFVGCYDRSVHCIEYLPAQRDTLISRWKVDMQSQVYATPLLVGRFLLVCTTSGHINLIDLTDDQRDDESERGAMRIVSTMRMDGELFGDPVAQGNAVFVGCRDNYLYKLLVHA